MLVNGPSALIGSGSYKRERKRVQGCLQSPVIKGRQSTKKQPPTITNYSTFTCLKSEYSLLTTWDGGWLQWLLGQGGRTGQDRTGQGNPLNARQHQSRKQAPHFSIQSPSPRTQVGNMRHVKLGFSSNFGTLNPQQERNLKKPARGTTGFKIKKLGAYLIYRRSPGSQGKPRKRAYMMDGWMDRTLPS